MTPVNSEAQYTSICLPALSKFTSMHDNLQIVREVGRTSSIFFSSVNPLQVPSYKWLALWIPLENSTTKNLKMTLVCLSPMFRPARRSTQSSL